MPYAPIFKDNQALRQKNYATVEAYLNCKGQDRAQRWKLYADDSNTGLGYTADCRPMSMRGIENQKEMERRNAEDFPDWSFWNNIIFQTEDPNYFIAEGEGGGIRVTPGRDDYYHGDHYFHTFRLRDGKIVEYREYMNPCKELQDMGVTLNLPVIPAMEGMVSADIPLAQARDIPYDENDGVVRQKNLRTVETYLACKGTDRANRWQLYAEDCVTGPGYTASCQPMKSRGLENQKHTEAVNARDFPDWHFYNNVIFQTADPNYFLVEGDGEGLCYFDPEKPFRHSDHYIHAFSLENGKIKSYHEYMNPCKELQDMGWDLGLPPMGPPPGSEQ